MLLGRYTLHRVGRPQKSYSPSTSIDPMRFKHRRGMRASAAHEAHETTGSSVGNAIRIEPKMFDPSSLRLSGRLSNPQPSGCHLTR